MCYSADHGGQRLAQLTSALFAKSQAPLISVEADGERRVGKGCADRCTKRDLVVRNIYFWCDKPNPCTIQRGSLLRLKTLFSARPTPTRQFVSDSMSLHVQTKALDVFQRRVRPRKDTSDDEVPYDGDSTSPGAESIGAIKVLTCLLCAVHS